MAIGDCSFRTARYRTELNRQPARSDAGHDLDHLYKAGLRFVASDVPDSIRWFSSGDKHAIGLGYARTRDHQERGSHPSIQSASRTGQSKGNTASGRPAKRCV